MRHAFKVLHATLAPPVDRLRCQPPDADQHVDGLDVVSLSEGRFGCLGDPIQDSSGICDYASAGSLQSRCSRLRAGLAPELVGPPTIPDHVPRAGALRGCSTGWTLPLAGTPDLGRSPSQVLKRSKNGRLPAPEAFDRHVGAATSIIAA